MSTNLNCEFVEIEPSKWYYLLEDWDAPKMAWDWYEYATAYGPFASQEKAREHLQRHHANPGGWGVCPFQEGFELKGTLKELIEKAVLR
jgi:hypothetical protein